MAQVDFTVADLEQFKLPYEEGMAITDELSKKIERIYHHFHERFLSLENEARADEHLSYALFKDHISELQSRTEFVCQLMIVKT